MPGARARQWLAAATAISLACASTPPYRAERLIAFLPGDFSIGSTGDVSIVACRLEEESVVRVLGARSAGLASNAAVFQVKVATKTAGVRILPDSFGLEMPSGEWVTPMRSGMVAGAVSGSGKFGSVRRAGSPPAMANTSQADSTADAVAKVALASATLGIPLVVTAIGESSESRYWESAHQDVEGKTGLPREVAPGQSLDLLVVFWPQTGRVPPESILTAELERFENGQACREQLVLREP